MSKNLKKLFVQALAIVSLFGVSSTAMAATIAVDEGEIRTLEIKTSEGDDLDFVKDFKSKDVVDYDGNDKNFKIILPKGIDEISVNTDVKTKKHRDENYVARIFTSRSNEADPYEDGDDIRIKDDYTTLYIRTYRSEDDFDDAYDDCEVSDCEETYKILIKKEDAKEDSMKEDNASNTIKLPELEINPLDLKVNPLEGNIQSHRNEWVKKGLYWVRYDLNGDMLRNTWYLDEGTGKYYFLQNNAYMTIGWRYIDEEWYYFNEKGEMYTGWIQSSNNKWYYLTETGAMARDTTINGYKINILGEFIG